MKTTWVATLDAGKFKILFQVFRNLVTVLFIGSFLLVFSCNKNDDLIIIEDDSSVDKEPPVAEEPPVDEEPTSEEPPVDEEPSSEEPPVSENPPLEEQPAVEPGSVIIYTDIEPDHTGKNIGDSYNLDLNNDQIVDFIISSLYETWNWLGISAVRNDGIISVEPWYTHTVPLKIYSKISYPVDSNIGQHYTRGSVIATEDCFENEEGLGCSYDWAGKYDRFIGLRITINEQRHFGWVRMEVTNVTQWTIKDYAYNATPDSPILAGQME